MRRGVAQAALVASGLSMAATAVAASFPAAPVRRCAPDAVMAGPACLDRYEASVWRVPNPTTTNAALVQRIRLGRTTLADLKAGGATQLGVIATDDYAPCADSGQNCAGDIYAVSLPGVFPSANLTWFQAQAACTNAGKRLPSNAEWQAAVDMVGNVAEYVADWVPPSTTCGVWTAGISPTDINCLRGAAETGEPDVLTRGGEFLLGPFAGPFAVTPVTPSLSLDILGFRCAR
ncbi:MAG TPA: hypothetical protein VLI07_01195 [Candidatus Binatus sp.]|nr:hypothetical protein [Candidatus Binatus sp.]